MPYLAACRPFCCSEQIKKKKKIGQECKQFHLDQSSYLIYELFTLYELLHELIYTNPLFVYVHIFVSVYISFKLLKLFIKNLYVYIK